MLPLPPNKSRTLLFFNELFLIAQALKGNIRAWELIRDTIGEKPSDKIETTQTTINIEDKKVIDKVMKNLKEL